MIKWFKQLILYLHHGLKSFSNARNLWVLQGVCEYSTRPSTLLYSDDFIIVLILTLGSNEINHNFCIYGTNTQLTYSLPV
jgi:hypothetical protein